MTRKKAVENYKEVDVTLVPTRNTYVISTESILGYSPKNQLNMEIQNLISQIQTLASLIQKYDTDLKEFMKISNDQNSSDPSLQEIIKDKIEKCLKEEMEKYKQEMAKVISETVQKEMKNYKEEMKRDISEMFRQERSQITPQIEPQKIEAQAPPQNQKQEDLEEIVKRYEVPPSITKDPEIGDVEFYANLVYNLLIDAKKGKIDVEKILEHERKMKKDPRVYLPVINTSQMWKRYIPEGSSSSRIKLTEEERRASNEFTDKFLELRCREDLRLYFEDIDNRIFKNINKILNEG